MPNVMDGINKMQEDQMRSQLAILQTVTMSNTFSELGQKASNKTVKIFNGLRKLFDSEPVKEPEVISLDERIAECKQSLDSKSRAELLEETRKVLITRMNAVGNSLKEDVSDDALSICIIEAACKNFKKEIDKELSPVQKADAVYLRYNERLLSQTQKKYKNATSEEKEKIDKQLQEGLNSLSAEQKEEMKKALRVEELTGETLKNLLTTSGGTAALLVALNASGFGAFIALTTIMHAVFTTTLQITLPFAAYTTSTAALSFFMGPTGWILLAGAEIFMLNRNKNKLIYELSSQVVWASVLECGGRFTPKDESLPSWLPEEQKNAAVIDNQQFLELLNRFKTLQEQCEEQQAQIQESDEQRKKREQEIDSLNAKIRKQEEAIRNAESSKSQLESDLENAQWELDKHRANANSENEELRQQYIEYEEKYKQVQQNLQKKADEIAALKQSNQDAQEWIELYDKENQEISATKKALEEENEKLKADLQKMEETVERAERKEEKKLQTRWEAAYKRFEFDTDVIKGVVKNYEYNEYGHLERRLMELHEAKDPAALTSNRGKMNGSGELHLGISTPSGFPSRIFYIPLKNAGGGKTVRITKICKHNDPRYGK